MIHTDPKTGYHYTTDQEEGADYVTVTEYIRKRHAHDLKKDAQADPLYGSSVARQMKLGHIIAFRQGNHYFIDWNKYGNYIFQRYRQIGRTQRKLTNKK